MYQQLSLEVFEHYFKKDISFLYMFELISCCITLLTLTLLNLSHQILSSIYQGTSCTVGKMYYMVFKGNNTITFSINLHET